MMIQPSPTAFLNRPLRAFLSKSNAQSNLAFVKNLLSPDVGILAMVKANAYGHGLRSFSMHMENELEALGVASLDEALALRKSGITKPIVLMEGIFGKEELRQVFQDGSFSLVLHHWQQIQWLLEDNHFEAAWWQTPFLETSSLPSTAGSSKRLPKIWLKVETGMNRLGLDPADVVKAYQAWITPLPHWSRHVGLLSHFACAEQPEHPLNAHQIDVFQKLCQDLPETLPKSMCNSAALMHFPQCHHQWVRPGILLYGLDPKGLLPDQAPDLLKEPLDIKGNSKNPIGKAWDRFFSFVSKNPLKPVMHLTSRLIALRQVHAGESVGYGGHYVFSKEGSMGIVAAGYGDGYPLVPSGTPVLLNGRWLCPIIGRVSMDMLAIDLGGVNPVQLGDPVTLWGQGLPLNLLAYYTRTPVHAMVANLHHRPACIWQTE